eukprot:m.294512 g.294512  ORF g.294512 m.294512 type:complete len:69 (+) comp16255_c1_seq1:59-265(+)
MVSLQRGHRRDLSMTNELRYYQIFGYAFLLSLAVFVLLLFSRRGQYIEGASFFVFAVCVVRYVLNGDE